MLVLQYKSRDGGARYSLISSRERDKLTDLSQDYAAARPESVRASNDESIQYVNIRQSASAIAILQCFISS